MSDMKRPTRKEAMDAFYAARSAAPNLDSRDPRDYSNLDIAGVNAVVSLLGGFASDIVEVPKFDLREVAARRLLMGPKGGPLKEIACAAARRSNCWEFVKIRVNDIIDALCHASSRAESARDLACELRTYLSQPVFGVGPFGHVGVNGGGVDDDTADADNF